MEAEGPRAQVWCLWPLQDVPDAEDASVRQWTPTDHDRGRSTR